MSIPDITGSLKVGSKGQQVRWVQEWLTLNGCGTGVDGDFGPATLAAVKLFQKKKSLAQSGVVTINLYGLLVEPMREALEPIEPGGRTPGQQVVAYARQHLKQHPREVGGDNRGPWVRLYMNGSDGPQWYWCAGFVGFILKASCDSMGLSLPINTSFSCDVLAQNAKNKGRFVSEDGVKDGATIKPGSLFLVRKTSADWIHTGIVVRADANVIHTIEGNTNDDGNRNGYEVCQRTRGYTKKGFISL